MALTYNALEKRWSLVPEKTDNKTDNETTRGTGAAAAYQIAINNYISQGGKDRNLLAQFVAESSRLVQQDRDNEAANAAAAKLNKENEELNTLNAKQNNVYNKVIATASTAQKGDYLSQRDVIRKLDVDENTRKDLEASYRQFYVNEKVDKWDPVFASKPLYGDFDAKYYKKNYPDVADTWKRYVDNDDVDVIERYGETGFFANHYTNVGKKENRRGNAAEAAAEADKYNETKATDAEIQAIRDKQLKTGTDETSELQDVINTVLGEEGLEKTKKFGALRQDVLKQTIAEMKKARGKEQMLSVFRGIEGFSEIMDINKSLTNSILGDSGIGGVLSIMGNKEDVEKDLEKSLQGITGIRNNVAYNWQQWFDETLKTRYQEDLELGLTTDKAEEKLKIEGNFARDFIDNYLKPRFNASRSMDEFTEYIDVKQDEQNVFQTQDQISSLAVVANARVDEYLNKVKNTEDRFFDSDFYFNPTGNKTRDDAYKEQALTVAQDWESAKKGDPYWAQQAYRYGVDINNKKDFARIHFQTKGQGKGYDAAEDIVNADKIKDIIYNEILPALNAKGIKQESIFGPFTTPEEFSDEILKGLNPENKADWDNVLKRFGLTNFKGTIDDLKQFIQETLRTGSAQTIRENIKYLNEKREEPTQEKLGITYIQREEDYKNKAESDTALFKTFQDAGYKGTEDDFYKTFFPDVDRSEQAFLTKAGKGDTFKMDAFDLSDPMAAFGTVESFLSGDEEPDKIEKEEKTKPTSTFFGLGLDDEEEEDEDYKSKTGSDILGQFTSFFK